ncbi:MAG: penicillin-binding protein 1C [Thermodesulfobacteriota bacterium]
MAVILPLAVFLLADYFFPLPEPGSDKGFAVAVVAEDGTPLRSFPDNRGVWRYPVRSGDVSPLYLEALINYEDRWFRWHPGVNPVSLLRSFYLYLETGRPVTGGSTLTMQAARILDPHSRTVRGKLKQIFRALQLELHYSKDEILTLYLNYAPFGGPIEGVQAASYAYLGRPAAELSHAEAALLAVLPQSPSRLRPDRHPDRATQARDKVLARLAGFGVWDVEVVREARLEKVAARFDPRPMQAPLLALRLTKGGRPVQAVRTFIDAGLQQAVTEAVQRHVLAAPPRTSAAVLIVENENLAVRAYVGSADFFDDTRFGHVDMVRALRSPGSTLKPFLYALALEEGLIHSESLLMDAPFSFYGYRPANFGEGFAGPVSAGEALRRSLNIPAVDLLDRLGPAYFDARLRQGGLYLRYPGRGTPNLTMILGGVGVTLADLTGAYASLARQGLAGVVRYTVETPLRERRLLSPGAAYIVRRMLEDQPRPDLPAGRLNLDHGRQVAWKTGTSYGFRDAWALGVTDGFTIGVWVGRPDGTPSPGQYGRASAAPLLFSLVDCLPRGRSQPPAAPASVTRREVCWPLGTPPAGADDPLCHQKRMAWILDEQTPPTLPDRNDHSWLGNPVLVQVNPDTGLRVDADCPLKSPAARTIARWPKSAGPWLSPHLKKASLIPRLDPLCRRPVSWVPETIRIVELQPGTILRPRGAETRLPTVTLQALGGRGRLFWFLDGQLVAEVEAGQSRLYQFKKPGRHRLTVLDLAGNYDEVEVTVLGGNPDA